MADLALVALFADAAVCDLRGFRIPDRVPVLAAILFLAVAAVTLDLPAFLLHLAAGATLFAVGAALFARGVWGGGDVKLVAAAALWTGFADLPRFLAVMALAGGVLALAVLAARAVARPAGGVPASEAAWHVRLLQSNHLPYGVAIAAAGVDWTVRAGVAG